MTCPLAVRRYAPTVLVALATLAVAVVGAWATPGNVGAINEGVETLAAGSSGALDALAAVLPFGFAFGAGLVSAVNPCGFAMLPAYLGLFLQRGGAAPTGLSARLGQALLVGLAVTVGFGALFGVAGVALGLATRTVGDALPWLGLGTGVLLVGVGAWTATGGTLYARFGERLAQGVAGASAGDGARGPGLGGYVAFGVAYGLASLSCTLPIFLAVVGSTLTLDGLATTLQQLLAFSSGMGAFVIALTVSLAVAEGALLAATRRALKWVGPVSAGLLLLAGAYIVYYWLTIGGVVRA